MPAIVCALISGALFFVSAGTIGWWWAMWLAPVPLLYLAFGARQIGSVIGASFAAYAVGQATLVATYHYTVPVPLLASSVALLALRFTLAVLAARLAARRLPALLAVFAFPAALTALEFATAQVSPNGSFGSIAYSQAGAPWLIQSAAFTGLWGITFLVGLAASLAGLALARGRTIAGFTDGALAVAIVAGNAGWGWSHIQAADKLGANVVEVAKERVGAAADDRLYKDSLADNAQAALRVTTAYAEAARVLIGQGAATIVLPEKIAILRPEWSDAALAPLVQVSSETGARIVAGFEERGAELRNSALTITPDGAVQRYYKRHLVPGLERHVPGTASGALGNTLAVAICKDMDFERTIRADAKGGIRMVLVPAWDFAMDGWAHARMAIFRGVENGFTVVRAARDGVLTLSDAQGRVLASARSNPHALVTLVGDVPLGPGKTLYTRIGDVFGWGAVGLILALMGLATIARGRTENK